MKGPIHVLPPTPWGIQCQAAISTKARRLTQQYAKQPLPRWRYCAWSGYGDEGRMVLCETHRRIADLYGTVRLLPSLKVWEPNDDAREPVE